MASNDKKNLLNPSLNSMAHRLGVFCPKPPVQTTEGEVVESHKNNSQPGVTVHNPKDGIKDTIQTSLEGIYHQSELLNNMGGHAQQERMIYDKKRSLDRALLYSYQGADIKKVDAEDDEKPCRALINPNKLKQDYDDKVVSCNWDYGLAPGNVFKWMGTDTYWLIYLQDLTELAYFRGNIRKCSYQIKWMDSDTGEIFSTYAAVRGPVETKINSVQKSGESIDLPNYSLSIIIPRNEQTLKYFRRYSKFYIQGFDEGSPVVCWRTEAVDWISTPGIIELVAQEYFVNKDVDDVGEIPEYKEIMDKIEQKKFEEGQIATTPKPIIGEGFIKPKITYTYTCEQGEEWKIESSSKNLPLEIIKKDTNILQIKWIKLYSGQFTIKCGTAEKTVVVETLY